MPSIQMPSFDSIGSAVSGAVGNAVSGVVGDIASQIGSSVNTTRICFFTPSWLRRRREKS